MAWSQSVATNFHVPGRTVPAAAAASVVNYLIGSIPVVTAQTLAVCRATFGLFLFYFWTGGSERQFAPLSNAKDQFPLTRTLDQTGLLTALSSSPTARFLLYWAIFGLLVAFIVGAFTRILYPVLVCLFWLGSFLQVQNHVITPLLLAMTATVAVPWSAAWSFDALLGKQPQPRQASPLYGYGIWLLGLTIGLTYTAAGLSKLILTDGGWIWDTGARNGFIQDFRVAVTDWGMVIANNYVLALLASIVSAVGQAVYVWACFTRTAAIKYAIGLLVAFPFLIGLALFMGVFWWPWAILVPLLYLPWPTIDRWVTRGNAAIESFTASPAGVRHRRIFLAATAGLIGIHTYAVVSRSEYEPVYSNYPMYADRMRAGSEHETKFWERYKLLDRHYKLGVTVLAGTGERDISEYGLARFLQLYRLWNTTAAGFDASAIEAIVRAGDPINPERCASLISTAQAFAPNASAIRYERRYVDLIDGELRWSHAVFIAEVDVARQPCQYRADVHVAAQ